MQASIYGLGSAQWKTTLFILDDDLDAALASFEASRLTLGPFFILKKISGA
jgi:hypothetical protein